MGKVWEKSVKTVAKESENGGKTVGKQWEKSEKQCEKE